MGDFNGFYHEISSMTEAETGQPVYFFEHESNGDTICLRKKSTLWRLTISKTHSKAYPVSLYKKLIAYSDYSYQGVPELLNGRWINFSMVQFVDAPLHVRALWGGTKGLSCPMMVG